MRDKNFSIGATSTTAWALWALAVLGVVLGWVSGHQALGQFGIVSAGAAATLHVRSFLCKQTLYLTEALDDQEKALRNAFDLGRDYEALHQNPKVQRIPSQPPNRNGVEMHR